MNSRYSGYLEFHDANLDGVVDHDVSDGNEGLEGRITSLLPSGKSLQERARESAKKANTQFCGKEEGTWNKDTGKRACFSPSGIVVDTGAAHGGDEDPHRKLRLSAEAAKAAQAAGKDYGQAAIRDIEKIMRKEYGLADNMKVAAIDELRSEAAWLEEQKSNVYERSWKSLRAARLANEDTAEDTAAGTAGAEFMHEVDLLISKGATDRQIAEEVAVNSRVQSQLFVKQGNDWVPYDAQKQPNVDPNAIKSFSDIKADAQREGKPLGADARYALHQQAKAKALEGLDKDQALQEDIAKIEGCMQKDVWCHNGNTAAAANAELSKNSQGQPLPDNKQVKAYTPVTGDPGGVFQDTREMVYLKMHEAQNAPIEKIEEIVTSLDFNRDTDPEYFKELDRLKKETSEMQKANEARGNKAYNTSTQSVREFSGIRQGLNDTFREANTDDVVSGSGGQGNNRGPAGGPGFNLGGSSTSPAPAPAGAAPMN